MAKTKIAGAIPYQIKKSKIRFLLVTSSSGRWIFPKGKVEPGDSKKETAAKEAEEEAGIDGEVKDKVGRFARRDDDVTLFLMDVRRVSKRWRERKRRRRKWCSYQDAARLLHRREHRRLLDRAHKAIKNA